MVSCLNAFALHGSILGLTLPQINAFEAVGAMAVVKANLSPVP